MKIVYKHFFAFLFCAGVMFFSAMSLHAQQTLAEQKLKNLHIVCDFLKSAGYYYLATTDGDQPHVRPFGTANIFQGRLYIQTARSKKVAAQLLVNGKAEICAMKDGKWIRIEGILKDDYRREAKLSMLNAYPNLKKTYGPDDPDTMVIYFKSATATIYSFNQPPLVMKF